MLALALPLLITVAWVLKPLGAAALATAAVASLVLLGLTVLAWYRYRRTEIRVGPGGVGERGFFGRVHAFPRERIAEVLRLETYRGDTLETVRQLFVVDAEGRCLVRMRGTFWDDASMDLVAPTLDAPESVRNEPVTLSELRASNPGLLFWFEGRGFQRG